jgi:hypothetical protein
VHLVQHRNAHSHLHLGSDHRVDFPTLHPPAAKMPTGRRVSTRQRDCTFRHD